MTRSDKSILPILGIALVLRFWAIDFGLPLDLLRPDEHRFITVSLRILSGDFNPHFFIYTSLYFYLLAGLFSLVALFQWMSGSIEFMWQFAAQGYFVDPSPFILTARSLSALVGTSTVLAVYFAGRAAYDRSADLIAALLSAIAPLCVRARGTLHFRRHSPPRLSGDVTCFHVSPTENRDFI